MTRVLWGACWYDEDPEQVAAALLKATQGLEREGVATARVVFDARHDRPPAQRSWLARQANAVLLPNEIPYYPNKNLGVYAIALLGSINAADLTIVCDPDWQVADFSDFSCQLCDPLLRGSAGIVVPDITAAAGRDNYLIGKPLLRLVAKEAEIPTPFPGVIAARSQWLAALTTSHSYHMDWGGEWDILAGALEQGLEVATPDLGMRNVRHRSSQSKAADAYQIWRAGLSRLALEPGLSATPPSATPEALCDALGRPDVSSAFRGSATARMQRLTAVHRKKPLTSSLYQLIPMVLAPLALLADGTDTRYIAFRQGDGMRPYDRADLPTLSDMAYESVTSSLVEAEPGWRERGSDDLHGGYLGPWTQGHVATARQKIEAAVVGPAAIRWK